MLEAIYHVVEHFAMHTGQIVLLTKAYSPDRIHFYDDLTPTARPVWEEPKESAEARLYAVVPDVAE